MLKHHEESIRKCIEYFSTNSAVLAVVLGGSVAKGLERPDSDIDAEVIVTDEYYDELRRENRTAESIFGECTYEGGYFDVKYFTKSFLRAAAERGSEPARNQWVKARCLYSRDAEIAELIPRIGVFQESERAEKSDSFYSALWLTYHYFWQVSKDDIYLRLHSAVDIVLFGYRLLLEDNRVLFPCHKSLHIAVAALPGQNKPAGIEAKSDRLLKEMSDEAAADFVDSILSFIEYRSSENLNEVISRYTDDFELWWYNQRPVIAEW